LKELNEDLKKFPELLKKLDSQNILHSIEKLSKEERNIILMKYYETIEAKHSFSVFKLYYLDFLEIKNLTKSVYTERIINFLKDEINKSYI
ncbi:MAG: hypothetical protein K6C97_00850, partial [Treponema sp.]|nr:hypothetical protein [Treponema sp.]